MQVSLTELLCDSSVDNPLDRLKIRVADASFHYGWEYLGIPDRLVQTSLTLRCYLTLTQTFDGQVGWFSIRTCRNRYVKQKNSIMLSLTMLARYN